MVIAVSSRANHYEILGVTPTATGDEIAKAFARQMRLPHPVPELAQIGIAFDTLRNPAKRRSYDEALGLRSEPKGQGPAMSFQISARLAALASAAPIGRPAYSSASPRPDLPAAATVAAIPDVPCETTFDGKEALAELTGKERLPEPSLQPDKAEPASPGLDDQPRSHELLSIAPAVGAENGFGLGRNRLTLGGLVIAVMALGAWAGVHARDSDPPAEERSPARVAQHLRQSAPEIDRPRATPLPTAAALSQHVAIGQHREPPRPRPSQVPRPEFNSPFATSHLAQNPVDGDASAAHFTPLVSSEGSAVLPLPRPLVARTIDRIGYSCGAVASAALVGEGVYTITCTSGQSFQAKPVRGRYRFRRL